MDSSTVFSDDDYDVVSNPSQDDPFENGFHTQELPKIPSLPRELPPFVDAQDRFETTCWTASEVQAFIRTQVEATRSFENRKVRVYVDGAFDTFGVR
jgi:choline-phosphate cytidylyltransferase